MSIAQNNIKRISDFAHAAAIIAIPIAVLTPIAVSVLRSAYSCYESFADENSRVETYLFNKNNSTPIIQITENKGISSDSPQLTQLTQDEKNAAGLLANLAAHQFPDNRINIVTLNGNEFATGTVLKPMGTEPQYLAGDSCGELVVTFFKPGSLEHEDAKVKQIAKVFCGAYPLRSGAGKQYLNAHLAP